MSIAYPIQKIQDWITQQWVILTGRRISERTESWLIGPMGDLGNIGDGFIEALANSEGLLIRSEEANLGLIESFDELKLSKLEMSRIAPEVIDFYENTSNYNLRLSVSWNPFFQFFGRLLSLLFSRRINQLNVPLKNVKKSGNITSRIVKLVDPKTEHLKYTIWHRTFADGKKVLYSGVYSVGVDRSGNSCVKAVFPLPKGNATVLMRPCVGEKGELILGSNGKQFGDAGFYFLLNDAKNNLRSNFIPAFTDDLSVFVSSGKLRATQVLKLWGKRVLQFDYELLKFR